METSKFFVSFNHTGGRRFERFGFAVQGYGPDDAAAVAYATQRTVTARSTYEARITALDGSGREWRRGAADPCPCPNPFTGAACTLPAMHMGSHLDATGYDYPHGANYVPMFYAEPAENSGTWDGVSVGSDSDW